MLRRSIIACGAGAAVAATFRPQCASVLSAQDKEKLTQTQRTVWEQVTQPPKFDSSAASRFDLGSYAGRALHFLDALGDLSTLLITGEKLRDEQALLAAHAAGDAKGATDAQLWRARKVVASSVHPATGEDIPACFRFTAFAPVNLIICVGLLRPGATLASAAFFQWMNQTYNAAVNWQNRAGGEEASVRELATGYLAATGAALGIGIGAPLLAKGLGASGRLVQLTVPMVAVSIASVVNLAFMRSGEMTEGVAVYTEDGLQLV